MIKAVFVPLTDDMLARHPELTQADLVPYHPDLPCVHWLDGQASPETTEAAVKAKARQD